MRFHTTLALPVDNNNCNSFSYHYYASVAKKGLCNKNYVNQTTKVALVSLGHSQLAHFNNNQAMT